MQLNIGLWQKIIEELGHFRRIYKILYDSRGGRGARGMLHSIYDAT